MVKQKLVEEVHLYCSPLELEEFIQHFCSSFIQKFHEIADLSTFSVEKESDDYDLSSEDAGKSNFEDCQNYVLKQKFTCMVHEIDGEPCKEDLSFYQSSIGIGAHQRRKAHSNLAPPRFSLHLIKMIC